MFIKLIITLVMVSCLYLDDKCFCLKCCTIALSILFICVPRIFIIIQKKFQCWSWHSKREICTQTWIFSTKCGVRKDSNVDLMVVHTRERHSRWFTCILTSCYFIDAQKLSSIQCLCMRYYSELYLWAISEINWYLCISAWYFIHRTKSYRSVC